MSGRFACLTIDMEPDLHDPDGRIRLLDDDVRLEAFAAFLTAEKLPLTCFIQLSQAARYLDRLNELAARADVEFAAHSYSHDTTNPASPDEVRRSWETFGELWNTKPLGYRAPNCLIDERGLDTLAAQGFAYDTSIVPALRPDKFGYNNLGYGRDPFFCVGPSGRILEIPVAVLGGIRLPFVFSYVKLFGLPAYQFAMNLFPLPDTVVTYIHPYDLYISEVAGNLQGWKRQAHLRNAEHAPELLVEIVHLLKRRGYTFISMRDLAARIANEPATPVHQLAT